MVQRASTASTPMSGPDEPDIDLGWNIALAAASCAERVAATDQSATFAIGRDRQLMALLPGDSGALVGWQSGAGWTPLLATDDPRHALLDLYLPICSATVAKPITIGHLGLSLDGFIATHTGESQFVTGHENILHLHRMRALCDAVIVGAGTVAADNPQLTTRLVPGPNPLRVVFDPTRRLTADFRIFGEDSVPTWYCCERSLIRPGESQVGAARIIGLEDGPAGAAVADVLRLLREHGCARVFVEGGGVTVSAFLEANLLDRLQMAIAPLIIGDGRPGIRVPARANLRDCLRPPYRVFRMGGDVLFDCDLTADAHPDDRTPLETPLVTRVI
jgi:diaminohydroxyphosphoribosylaminopyrimidine deaminase / 5-amino-6-(5-phosphoribosylamino)uracil reductase